MSCGLVQAFPGELDTTFGGTGKVLTGIPVASSGAASGYAMALQADGKIVMAGSAGSGSGQNFAVARFNTVGTLDSTFGTSGAMTTAFGTGDDHANGVAIQSDGRIVAAGASFQSSSWHFALTRYNANGTADTAFGNKITQVASTYNEAYAVAIDGSGNIVLAGKTGDGSATDFAVVRYTAAGALDVVGFNGSGKVRTPIPISCPSGCVGQAQALAIQSDGKIVVAGWSGPVGNSDFVLVRYNANGSLDPLFGSSGIKVHAISASNDQALAVKVITLADTTERILVAGITNPTNSKASYAIARYTMSGAVDTAFGTNGVVTTGISGGNDIASSVAIDAAGMIVVGGDQNDLAGDFVVARYTASGVLDNTFGCAVPGTCMGFAVTNFTGTDQGKAVAIQVDGNIVLAGVAAAGTTSAKFAVARYLAGGGGTGSSATQLAVTSVNGGSPVAAGIGFAVVVQSRNGVGAPTNVVTATQVSLTLTTGTGPLSGTTNCIIPAAGNTCTASGLTLTTAQGGAVITATRISGDALSSGAGAPFSVVAGPATNLVVSGHPASTAAGTANTFTARARDAYNNTATGYTGTVRFTSTDPVAVLPPNYLFVAGDAGQHTFSATLKTVGTWSLTATDTVTGSITGTQSGLAVTAGPAAAITVVSGAGQNTSVNANFAFPLVANVKDAFGNVAPGVQVTFTAPASGPSATFTGGLASIAATTDANGNASSGTVKANLTAGSYTVAASSGALAPATFSLTNSAAAAPTVAMIVSPSTINLGQTTTVTATVSGSAGTPTGTVSVSGASGNCTVTLVNGTGTCTLTGNRAGATQVITGAYSGNGTYASSNGTTTLSVNKVTPTVTMSVAPSTIGVGGTTTVTATVSSPAGTPSGTVAVSGAGGSCTITLAAGSGTCVLTGNTAGSNQSITGNYGGDINFNAWTGNTALTVNVGTAAVNLSAAPSTITVGGTTTITASVSGGSGTATGTVAVSGAGGSCTITLAAGSGNCVLTAGTAGASQVITGNYSGNGTYAPSTGATTLTVNASGATATVTLMSAAPSTIAVGGTTTITATVSGGAGTPTGTVTVSGAGGSCTITLAAGSGNCVLTAGTAGASQILTGNYGGNGGTYAPSTGTTTLTVNKLSPTVSIGVMPNSTNVMSPVTVSASVSGSAGIPTGTINISGAGGACTVTLVTGGGSCQLTPTVSGNGQTVTATYTGDGNYANALATTSLNVRGATTIPVLDVDLSGAIAAPTDGVLVTRYLLGLRGTALTNGALGLNAQRTDPAQIVAYLDAVRTQLDIDDNGPSDALTDGLLIVRYLFGNRGTALIQGVIGPNATRVLASDIEAHLATLVQ